MGFPKAPYQTFFVRMFLFLADPGNALLENVCRAKDIGQYWFCDSLSNSQSTKLRQWGVVLHCETAAIRCCRLQFIELFLRLLIA